MRSGVCYMHQTAIVTSASGEADKTAPNLKKQVIAGQGRCLRGGLRWSGPKLILNSLQE